MYNTARKQLSKLLDLLGFTSNPPEKGMEELNERIKQYHEVTQNFNGPNLREFVINPLKGKLIDRITLQKKEYEQWLDDNIDKFVQIFSDTVDAVAKNEFGKEFFEEDDINEIVNELWTQMNFDITIDIDSGKTIKKPTGGTLLSNNSKKIAASAIRAMKSGILRNGKDPNFLALIKQKNATSRNFRNRLLQVAQRENVDLSAIQYPENTLIEGSLTETDTEMQLYIDFTNLYTQYMTPDSKGVIAEKAARNFFETKMHDTQFMNQFQEDAWNYFQQYWSNSLNLSNKQNAFLKDCLKRAIIKIATDYPAAFFFGGNEQGIIGIFGEIQGLFYIYAILGENNKLTDTEAQWIGGDTTAGDGVKTSADLVLKSIGNSKGYGIQVKNSMSLTSDTGFSDFALNQNKKNSGGFIEQLTNFGIDYEVTKAIEDIFTMGSFNIPYKIRQQKAIKGNSNGPFVEIYKDDRENIDRLFDKANKLMTLAAAMILRVRYLEEQDYNQANTLYLIGGTSAISAAQILDTLIKQIKNEIDAVYKVSASTQMNSKTYNIIDWINAGRPELNGIKTTLSSSFNFHKI